MLEFALFIKIRFDCIWVKSNFHDFMVHLELTDLRNFVTRAKTVNSANITHSSTYCNVS